MKSDILIGSTIKNWEVIDKVKSDKKYSYTYRCRCIKCGNTRTYNKYYLNEDNSLECSKCIAIEAAKIKYKEFKHMCQEDIPGIDDIDIDKPYKLKCDNGHAFISSLNKFKSCIRCESYGMLNKNIEYIVNKKLELEQYIYDSLNDIMEFTNMERTINILDKEYKVSHRFVSKKHMIIINVISELDKKFYIEHHGSRSNFIRDISLKKRAINKYRSEGYLIWDVISTGDTSKDIESIENTKIKLLSIIDE